jgi:hypothetical protein
MHTNRTDFLSSVNSRVQETVFHFQSYEQLGVIEPLLQSMSNEAAVDVVERKRPLYFVVALFNKNVTKACVVLLCQMSAHTTFQELFLLSSSGNYLSLY